MNSNFQSGCKLGAVVGLLVLASALPASAAVMFYQTEVMADNPVGFWRMSETSGTVMNDSSGFSRNGTYNANVSLGAAGVGIATDGAAMFNGSNASASIPDDSAYDFLDYTLEAWVQINGPVTSDMRVVSHQSSQYWLMHLKETDPGVVKLSSYSSLDSVGNFNAGPNLNDGEFHHLAITRDTTADLISLYVDGVPVGSTAATNNSAYNIGASVFIGSYSGTGQYFPGIIDEVALYGSALSAARIEQHFISGTYFVPVPEPNSLALLGCGTLMLLRRKRSVQK